MAETTAEAPPIYAYPTTDAERYDLAWNIFAWVKAHPELHDPDTWAQLGEGSTPITAARAASCGTAGCYGGWGTWLTGASIGRMPIRCCADPDCTNPPFIGIAAVRGDDAPVSVREYVTTMLNLHPVAIAREGSLDRHLSSFTSEDLYAPENSIDYIAEVLTILVGPAPSVRAVQDHEGTVWFREGDGAGTWRCAVGDRTRTWHDLLVEIVPEDVTEQVGA